VLPVPACAAVLRTDAIFYGYSFVVAFVAMPLLDASICAGPPDVTDCLADSRFFTPVFDTD
jgi:hypothetical protein